MFEAITGDVLALTKRNIAIPHPRRNSYLLIRGEPCNLVTGQQIPHYGR